jgi:hypothetical protein
MADPLSIAAIVGLIFAARKCSEANEENPQVLETNTSNFERQTPIPEAVFEDNYDNRSIITNTYTGTVSADPGQSGQGISEQAKDATPSFGDVGFMGYPNGEPVHDFRDRPYVSGKMNNFGPVEKTLVGPGLGVGKNVPAYGGYQQLFRVMPNNVNGYKLTTLPGRSGPAGDVTGGRRALEGKVTYNMPEKTAFLPARRPELPGRAQGQGGAVTGNPIRGNYEKTKRPTNRSETTLRQDGLEFNPAKSTVSALTLSEAPTRNKGDLNVNEFQYSNQPTPGISNFVGGYTIAPGSELLAQKPQGGAAYSPQQLEQFGFRPDTRRGQKNRDGNAGRMNVRASPLNQNGLITAVRSDCNRLDGRLGPANGSAGGRMQNYVQDEFYQLNAYKGNANPHSTSRELGLVKNQLMGNPFSHTLS